MNILMDELIDGWMDEGEGSRGSCPRTDVRRRSSSGDDRGGGRDYLIWTRIWNSWALLLVGMRNGKGPRARSPVGRGGG